VEEIPPCGPACIGIETSGGSEIATGVVYGPRPEVVGLVLLSWLLPGVVVLMGQHILQYERSRNQFTGREVMCPSGLDFSINICSACSCRIRADVYGRVALIVSRRDVMYPRAFHSECVSVAFSAFTATTNARAPTYRQNEVSGGV
jgi:hypothetical protein